MMIAKVLSNSTEAYDSPALLNSAMKRFLKALRLYPKSGEIIAPFSNAGKEQEVKEWGSSQDLNQQTINVGHWLTDRLDAVAQKLGWMLLPPLAPAAALRSAQEELAVLGVQLPPEARGAYEDLQLACIIHEQ